VTEAASYVYLAARELSDDAVTGVTGLSDRPLRLVRNAGLTAVVSTVDLEEFGEAALRRNLEDLGWLEGVVRTRDEVVNRIGRLTAVAPWRLATIMNDDDRVAKLLDTWRVELTESLERVEGCSEWSVKMYADLSERPAAGSGATEHETGTAYLQRRRTETARHADAAQSATVAADQIHLTLSQLTAASRRLPPQDRRLTGHTGEMVLNGAYLVADAESQQFTSLVEELGGDLSDARLDLNGPWPPYSFATLESGGGG